MVNGNPLGKRLKEYFKFLKSLMLTNARLISGMWKLTKLPQPAITVFGGSRLSRDSIYAKQAEQLAEKLAANGFSIITGGGAGIMEAANYGALQASKEWGKVNGEKQLKMTSVGIGLFWLTEGGEKTNKYVQDQIIMYHFFSRKWLLVRYSVGFAVFPGGFGTLDETFEVITLIQASRMPHFPIVLLGQEYWQPIIDWAINKALKEKLISEEDLRIVSIARDVDHAFELLCQKCEKKDTEKHLYEE
ncbi:MAG: TIGR00730 family Rossman fold protein [bacterium]